MTEYTFNGKPLTKITNSQEQDEFHKQYDAEVRAGHTPSVLPLDVKYMQQDAVWVYFQISEPSDKMLRMKAIGILRETYKVATPEEKDTLMQTMLQFNRGRNGEANNNLGKLAAELYRNDEDKVDFSYLTRCYMKLNADSLINFSNVSLDDKVPHGEAGNFEKNYVPKLFENLNFAEQTNFLRGVALNKYGYVKCEALEQYINTAAKSGNCGETLGQILPLFTHRLADSSNWHFPNSGDKLISIARDTREAKDKEQLLYSALCLNINLGNNIAYSTPLGQALREAQAHVQADRELKTWNNGGVVYDFGALVKYHQDQLDFSPEHLNRVNSKERLNIFQHYEVLTPQNRTELAHNLIDDNLASNQIIEKIIDEEMQVAIPNNRNLELSEKLKTKVGKIKATAANYQAQMEDANSKLKNEKQCKKKSDETNLVYKQQSMLLNAAAKIKLNDDKNKPKIPLYQMELAIAAALNSNRTEGLPLHKIGFFTLGKEKKLAQNEAINEFNQAIKEIVKNPSGLKQYSGKVLEDASTHKIRNQYNQAYEEYRKAQNAARYAQDDVKWISQELPDMQRIGEKFDALYVSQENVRNEKARQEHLQEVRSKARENLKKKGMSVEEKFGGIEADKKAKKTIIRNEIDKLRQEKAEGKNYATMRKNADKAIDDMAQRDADRLNKILENQPNIDKERAKDSIVKKDKHVSGQNSAEYTQKVKEKMLKGK